MTRPPTSLTFTGGLRTPSGTRFHVTAGGGAGGRACFDLGLAYNPAGNYFDGRVRPRPDRFLTDLLALGLAPRLPGLFAAEALGSSGLPPGPDGRTAVFISHLHLDHMALLPYVAEGIPVYMSPDSARLLAQLDRAGLGFAVSARRSGAVRVLQAGQTVSVGELTVTGLPVDHDVPGALGFLVDTPEGTVVYSGDLRTHGYRGAETAAFVAAAAERRPRLLVMEATRMGEEPAAMLTEDEVIEEMVRAGAAVSGLVMVLPYPRNVERIRRLPEVAHRMGRRLVMEAGIAGLLAEDSARSPDQQASSARAEVLTDALVAQIRSDPRSFVVQLSYAGLATLLDLQPPPGSLLVHSDGEPLGAYDPATANLQRWLERFAAGYRVVRSSGHAAPAELLQMVAEIGPQALIPLHGLRPELLSAPGVRQVLPLPDVPYGLDGAPLQG